METTSRSEPIVQKSKRIMYAWREYLESRLPSYAFAYEEGDRYVKAEYMIRIEQETKDIYIKCLENGGFYDMLPGY